MYNKTMKIYTEEELNNLSREELIALQLNAQEEYSTILERIASMNANTYGRKSEKFVNPDQIVMEGFNETEAAAEEETESSAPSEEITVQSHTRKKSVGKRDIDLSKFEVQVVNHELPEEVLVSAFGEGGWSKLPDQIYKKLEVHPAKYEVMEHHIFVYKGSNGKIIKADHPAEVLNNSIATPSLVASVMNAKYTNAMPLYRIEQEFERNEINISRQVMANWMIKCSERYFSMLYDRLHEEMIKTNSVLQADETTVIVSKDGKPTGSKSQIWLYRTGEYNTERPIILYDYKGGRSADNPLAFLKGFKGVLECDAYGGYGKVEKVAEDITVACCWAHLRRRFSDAVKAYGVTKAGVEKTLAGQALAKIGKIYNLDEGYKKLPSEERLKRRQSTVRPKVDEYFAWVKEHQNDTGSKDKTAEGFRYSISHEAQLRRFLENGLIPIDNSASERSIRPVTVGRKNWVMIDTVNGATASATIYSIVETAKANDLKPFEYMKHLLTEMPKHMDDTDFSFLDDLMPWSEDLPDICKMSWKKKSKNK